MPNILFSRAINIIRQWRYAEIILFCVVFSLTFALMGQVVKTVDPIIATFVTYGLAALWFVLLNIRHLKQLVSLSWQKPYRFALINATTLVNTALSFVVMRYVPPLAYVMVFFSALPLFDGLLGRRSGDRMVVLWLPLAVLLLALVSAALVSPGQGWAVALGLGLTLVSAPLAVVYMQASAQWHQEAGLSSSQLLALRFWWVVLVCGAYSWLYWPVQTLTVQDWLLLAVIAIFGSVVPLFLMQAAIRKIGAAATARFTPSIPVLCLLFMVLLGQTPWSWLSAVLAAAVAALLLWQTVQARV